jgi:2-methylisocitrate lyase-like PEP mutase family enzyme
MGAPRTSLVEKARRLRELHRPGDPLLLANVWDVASARAVAATGVPAIATTSAGVAEVLGYEDGEAMPAAIALAAVGRIVAAVDVPVTADLESGYGLDPDRLVEALLDGGAVGCNIEDSDHARGGLESLDVQAARIGAIKEAAGRQGVDLVLNARVDLWVDPSSAAKPAPDRLREGLERGRRYAEAGADCVYPIRCAEESELRAFVAEGGAPVNAYWFPGGPSLAQLRAWGVARISVGPNLFRETSRWVAQRAAELRRDLDG